MDKLRDREIAEELVQETFIAFHKNKPSLDKLNTALPLLYVILKHKILDHYRRLVVQRKYYDDYSRRFSESDDNSTLALIQTRELEKLLNDEIEKLPPQCRRVFLMRRKEWMSNKDIASALDISENTVEQHMRKALRILRISFINHDVWIICLFMEIIVRHCMAALTN